MLREMAESTGLVDGVTAALLDTYKGLAVHAAGRVFADLACAVADEVCFLSSGTIVERGAPQALLHDPQDRRTRDFLRRVHEAGRI